MLWEVLDTWKKIILAGERLEFFIAQNVFGLMPLYYRIIRDSLVEKIWEGTTTVLSLDLVRAARDPSTLKSFIMVSL